MTTTCQVDRCDQPVQDAYVCTACAEGLRTALSELADWLGADIDNVLARQTVYGDRAGGRSAERPLPYDPRAAEVGWVLRNTVTTWARIIHEERGVPLPQVRVGRNRSPHVEVPLPRVERCEHADLPTTMCYHCRERA